MDSGGGGAGADGPSSSRASRSIRRLGTFSKSSSFVAAAGGGPPRSGSMARLGGDGGGSSMRSLELSSTVRSTNALRVFVGTLAVTVEKFRAQGGVKAVVAPLRTHPGAPAVVDAACRVLLALTIHGAVATPTGRDDWRRGDNVGNQGAPQPDADRRPPRSDC